MTKLPGKIIISRIQSNKRVEDEIEISFIDDRSNIHFATAKMSLETFALALTGLGHLDVELDVRGLENIGKIKEMSTYPLFFDHRNVTYAEVVTAWETSARHIDHNEWKMSLARDQRLPVQSSGSSWKIVLPIYRYVEVEDDRQ